MKNLSALIVLVTVLLPELAIPQVLLANDSSVPIARVLAEGQRLLGQDVVIEGEIERINYRPEIREGRSVYSFFLASQNGPSIRVLNTMVALLGAQDTVRVKGQVVPGAIDSQKVEIDARKGSVEILEGGSTSSVGSLFQDALENPQAVPVSSAVTSLGRAEQIGSIVAASVAVLSFLLLGLVLRARRFNIGLDLMELERIRVDKDEHALLEIQVVVFSTSNLPVHLRKCAELRLARMRFRARGIETAGEASFPLTVRDQCELRLKFEIPLDLSASSRGQLALFDAFSRRKFSLRLPPATVRRAQRSRPGGAAADSTQDRRQKGELPAVAPHSRAASVGGREKESAEGSLPILVGFLFFILVGSFLRRGRKLKPDGHQEC